MGVKACDRVGCDHVMCDRVILDGHAYICESCWDELVAFRKTWPDSMTKAEVHQRIVTFMRDTAVGTHVAMGEAEIETEFKRLTGYRD